MVSKLQQAARDRAWKIHQLKMIKSQVSENMSPRSATIVIDLCNQDLIKLGAKP